ncbi:MAG: ice-binding family protein [Acidobacteriaceae bacterium]
MSVVRLSGISTTFLAAILLMSCGSNRSPNSVTTSSDAPPTVATVVPQSSGYGTNRLIGVVFSKAMDPASINASTFLVTGVPGTVSYDATNMIGYFKSSADYAVDTKYNANITTGATNASGTPLAAPFSFSFTTRSSSDKSAPTVNGVNLAAGATCVPLNQKIDLTFDEQMNSLTINPSTCFIQGPSGNVPETVLYHVLTQTALLTPTSDLAANTTYTITATTGVQDLGGVPLSSPFHQNFTTGPCQGSGVSPVILCPNIGNFSVLAGSTVTNTGPTTVSGNVGVSPGTAITGFPPGTAGGTIQSSDGATDEAQITLAAAYEDAAGRPGGKTLTGDLAGQTLTSGVYTATSSLEDSGDVTLDGQGNPSAVFIFQIGSTLTTASGSHIILVNGASPCNVFWQVGSSATLGTGSVFNGNILAMASITVTTGVTLNGSALARTGAVTLDDDVITSCPCAPGP